MPPGMLLPHTIHITLDDYQKPVTKSKALVHSLFHPSKLWPGATGLKKCGHDGVLWPGRFVVDDEFLNPRASAAHSIGRPLATSLSFFCCIEVRFVCLSFVKKHLLVFFWLYLMTPKSNRSQPRHTPTHSLRPIPLPPRESNTGHLFEIMFGSIAKPQPALVTRLTWFSRSVGSDSDGLIRLGLV